MLFFFLVCGCLQIRQVKILQTPARGTGKELDVISYATQFLVLHSKKNKKTKKDRSKTSAQKIGGWYVMSSAKQRKREPDNLNEEPSWKEILEANQADHDVYSQFARFPRNHVLPSITHRKARELELQRSSPRPDLYQLNNNWAV